MDAVAKKCCDQAEALQSVFSRLSPGVVRSRLQLSRCHWRDSSREGQDRTKFDRTLALAESLPTARGQVTRALRQTQDQRTRALAAAFRMLDPGSLRIGSERYAETNGSRGRSTLLCSPADVHRDVVTLRFPAKNQRMRSRTITQAMVDAAQVLGNTLSIATTQETQINDGGSTADTVFQEIPPELHGETFDEPRRRWHRNPVSRFLAVLRPRLATGAADDDPSGIATHSQAGATCGNSLPWTAPLTLPLMMAVQEICNRMPVLAASGAAGMASLLSKDWGLERSPRKAPLFYILLGVGIVAGTVLTVVSTDPIGLLILSAIVNGIAAGPFLIVMMLISRDRKITGKYRNGKLAATLGWTTTVVMCVAGVYGIWFTLFGG